MSATKSVILTGAAGFVGSHVVRHLLTNTQWHLYLPVTFRNRGDSDRLRVATQDHLDWQDRITVIYHDLRAPFSLRQYRTMEDAKVIINMASESHVDRSIQNPSQFIQSNVAIMTTMLDAARDLRPELFIQISTDEVYGPISEGAHAEWSPIMPSNPYSASKAAQEAIAISYWRTYGVPLVLTNTMNIFGETQDREKFIPKTLRALLRDEPATIHVGPDGTPGSRFYLHARNQADALLFLVRELAPKRYGEAERPARVNIVGDEEVNNLQMVNYIAEIAGKTVRYDAEDFHSSRPGHDLRYALDGTLLADLGWRAPLSFRKSLERTIAWTLDHTEWLL